MELPKEETEVELPLEDDDEEEIFISGNVEKKQVS